MSLNSLSNLMAKLTRAPGMEVWQPGFHRGGMILPTETSKVCKGENKEICTCPLFHRLH